MKSLPITLKRSFEKLRSRYFSSLLCLVNEKERSFRDCCLKKFDHRIHSVTEAKAMAQDPVGLSLSSVVQKMTKFAPLSLAESWDNVGLLVEPSSPKQIKKILLTNDLTERVLDETIALDCDLIISYHPPIFVPLKSLTTRTWKERIIVKCIENRIAVFSPHTSHDSVYGGVNDWMASTFDAVVAPLTPAQCPSLYSHLVEVVFPNSPAGNSEANEFQKRLRQYVDGCGEEPVCDLRDLSVKEMKMSIPCTERALGKVVMIFNETRSSSEEGHLRITNYAQVPMPLCGTGRMCTLKQPVSVGQVVDAVKTKIGLPHIRLALVPGRDTRDPVNSVAICVGSGTSVLRGVKADLYLTGEMLHHDVLDAVHKGSHVILCNHSDSERGFLVQLAQKLSSDFSGAVNIFVSKEDKDPLITV